MIKINQIFSEGWSRSIEKIREKLLTNWQQSLKLYIKCAMQRENRENQNRPSTSFIFHANKGQRTPEEKVEWKQNYLI